MSVEKNHSFPTLKMVHRKKRPADELPVGYSPYSSATYYTEETAKEIKTYLDTLDPNNKTKEIVFPVTRFKSVNTVYQQIYLGWRFLCERLDTADKKYSNLRAQMSLRKEKDRVRLYWNSRSPLMVNGVAIELEGIEVSVENPEVVVSWKEAIMKWALEAKDGSVEERKITFSDDEVDWIRNYLASFTDIVIVRLNNSGYKLTKNAKLAAAIREERGE